MPPYFPPLLDRQQARRRRGVPTVSVLAGPARLGLRAWRDWAEAGGRTACPVTAPDPVVVAGEWARCLFRVAAPAGQARAWLWSLAGTDAAHDRMTRYDLDRVWLSLPADPTSPVARTAYRILADDTTGSPTDPVELARELAARGGPAAAVCGLAGLYPESLWPALLLAEPADCADPAAWFADALATAELVATAVPPLALGIAARAAGPAGYLAARPASRAAALAREGLVELRGVTAGELESRLQAAGVDPPAAAAGRLAAAGLADEAADGFVEAARAVRHPTAADVASDFRSVHERFLFEQLESLPETAGLFRPNAELPFRHGPRAAEADLLAAGPRVAVEVDGGVYHLTPDQYRRDRRKDWLYQRHGYLVLRFLAEDVVEDLEAILAAIVNAVSQRPPR